MLLFAVCLSVVGLALGPILLAWGKGRALPGAAIDGFTLGLVPSVVLLRLAPHVYEEVGPLSIALVCSGYIALWLIERRQHRALGRAGQVVALPALVVHAAADGATLAVVLGQGGAEQSGASEGGALLALALLIHRLPEGLFVARALVPESGWRSAIAWICALALVTAGGALLGERVLSLAPHEVFHGIVAVGLGAILRLATHTHEATPHTRGGRLAFLGAMVSGLLINAAVPAAALRPVHDAPLHDADVATVLGRVALLVVVLAGLLRLAPSAWSAKILGRRGVGLAHDHDHRSEAVKTTPPASGPVA